MCAACNVSWTDDGGRWPR
ncbi:hypothetical protein ACFQDF_23500 [Ectobacillus funiculus]|uniref:Uncharacterized protein n=1 Tax=Ectobacillus funiculus TaxID=137993 RepID=A0ABV5WH06_9BACI